METELAVLIQEYIEDPTEVLERLDKDTLGQLVTYCTKHYSQGPELISDELYEMLADRLEVLDENHHVLKIVGAPVNDKIKIPLPVFMPSMDKFYPKKGKVDKWTKNYKGSYIEAPKYDGVSGLVTKEGLCTRGDGEIGGDISLLRKYIPDLKNVRLDDNVYVRGELIIRDAVFNEKYASKYKNARAMMAGISNSKTLDIEELKDVNFVAYELITDPPLPLSKQYEKLATMGYNLTEYQVLTELSDDILGEILDMRRKTCPYKLDGLIITDDNVHERAKAKFPAYAFAFKDVGETAEVLVKAVLWKVSEKGKIKPRLSLEPTPLSGVTIRSVTAYNAKFIADHNIGPGSIIKLVRGGEVTPDILEVIKGTTASLPTIPCKWNKTGVDLLVDKDNMDEDTITELIIRELTHFFKKLDIKNIDTGTITKLVTAGLLTIPAILTATIDDLTKIPGIQNRLATKLYSNIQDGIRSVKLENLMVASNKFDHGIGISKIKLILAEYPDVLNIDCPPSDLANKLAQIKGCGPVTSKAFVERLPDFKQFLSTVPMIRIVLPKARSSPTARPVVRPPITDEDVAAIANVLAPSSKEEVDETIAEEQLSELSAQLAGHSVVFSGFRNKHWEEIIVASGGRLVSAVSSKTTLLVTKSIDSSAKIKKAQELKVPIMDIEQFSTTFGLE